MCRTHARAAQRALRPGHYKMKVNARRSIMRRQTPPWASMSTIEAFYRGCPAGHEVDHFYPLQGETVSGLHVESNLQYLPTVTNRQKGNSIPC
jgi:hypothetical protein